MFASPELQNSPGLHVPFATGFGFPSKQNANIVLERQAIDVSTSQTPHLDLQTGIPSSTHLFLLLVQKYPLGQ